MAKAITERPTAFTAAIPCKTKKFSHTFQLGGGDLAIPLVFAVSVLNTHGFWSMFFTLAGALTALLLLFAYVFRKPGKALPALPPISAGACLGFALSLIL
jgi:presenilin-like A22 family membrane protease